MAKTKRSKSAPQHPERKYGPFHGGVGVAIWLNQVEIDGEIRYFRSVTVAPRRFRDKKTGEWKDSSSFRPTDLAALVLAFESAQAYIANTPLPGEPAEDDIDQEPAEGDGSPPVF